MVKEYRDVSFIPGDVVAEIRSPRRRQWTIIMRFFDPRIDRRYELMTIKPHDGGEPTTIRVNQYRKTLETIQEYNNDRTKQSKQNNTAGE